MEDSLRFQSLTIRNWRQFEDVRVAFHPQLTVITGANATGKSTLLGILAVHFDWARSYSATPLVASRSQHLWSVLGRQRMMRNASEHTEVGMLEYSDDMKSGIHVPPETSPGSSRVAYSLRFTNQRPVQGSFLTSHRSIPGNYIPLDSIPVAFGSPTELYNHYTNELRTRWLGGWSGRAPQLAFKETLMAAAVFGQAGGDSIEPNPEASEVWEGYQRVLRQILPESLGFIRLRVRVPDILVLTNTGDFILDEASGGLAAVMEMAWQIFLRSKGQRSFTVLLDEPENHLHPSLQRALLPNLLRAFPHVQFIVATHSPFIVTAQPDASVVALDYGPDQRVFSRELDYANKAAGADETLRQVLGLGSTSPIWAEARFSEIIQRYLGRGISEDQLAALRLELRANGLEQSFPEAFNEVADSHLDNE